MSQLVPHKMFTAKKTSQEGLKHVTKPMPMGGYKTPTPKVNPGTPFGGSKATHKAYKAC